MCTLKLFVILLLALLVLGVLAFVFDSVKETESDNPNYPTRAYKIARACSFIVKFGMVLTACGIIGSLVPAGFGLAMAFAIPRPTSVPKGSWFDHSHNVATTLPFGAVVPVDWRFMLPGEKYKSNISGFCRALMLKAPAMQDVDLKYATYFVPTRLLCDSNEEIIAEIDPAPSLSNDPLVLDVIVGDSTKSFPFLNLGTDFYRTLVESIVAFKKTSTTGHYTFDFDKFSTALGQSASVNDLAATARSLSNWLVGGLCDYMGFPAITDEQLVKICDIYGSKSTIAVADLLSSFKTVPMSLLPFKAYQSVCNHFFVPDFQRRSMSSKLVDIGTSETGVTSLTRASILMTLRYSQYESDPYTCARTSGEVKRVGDASIVDTSNLGGFNANTIRGMFALDEYARKIEYFFGDLRKQIKYMFGVVVSDKSALSPILVNAGSCPIGVSEVQNTSLDPVNSEQSSQSLGKMTAGFGKRYDTFEVEEHGVMLTCVWVRPRTSYMNKLPHLFRTFTTADTIPNPLFSEVGEVSLSAYDVDYNPFYWLCGNSGSKVNRTDDYFGYNSRYVEWKYSLDSFTGDFRGPLAYWHCAREFGLPESAKVDQLSGSAWLTSGYDFNLINGKYTMYEQPLNRIFTQVQGIPNVRPFQLQLRFNTQIWQLYPHIDDEL